ncbi:MAG: 4-alpha-glucanotransferase [Frankiaceae bacterium]|nr:4-alpha-glucanotransferase [Frankiaceae bacterium]
MSAGRKDRALAELAQLRGVQLGYTGADGRRVRAGSDTIRAVLAALGHPVPDSAAVAHELALAAAQANRLVEPVIVSEPRGGLSSPIRLSRNMDISRGRVTVTREDGTATTHALGDVTVGGRDNTHDIYELAVDLTPLQLPPGYHELTLEGFGEPANALLLVPPPPPRHDFRRFGVFAPLYALRAADDWGVGDFGDLADFADLVEAWNGDLAGTLPLYSAFFRDPVDPSPYLPVSRLFWNELYVDMAALPEIAADPDVAAQVGAVQPQLDRLRALPSTDHGAVMARKRRVLEACARALVSTPSDRRDEFDRFVKTHPELDRYADFRATDEALGPWQGWSEPAGQLPQVAGRDTAVLYHRYAQFVATEQLERAASHGSGLYLDLPVGVHPDGYDTWANAALFGAAEVGAPPDPFFKGGQAWGFPPPHPERMREDRYQHQIEVYRSAMRHAGAIRIDHVLGLQRLFWIPQGAGADRGAYVRYRSEETRAIIAIEAQRSGTVVVGEDLGTVSPSIRRAMDRDGMLHTFVYQFEASASDPRPQPKRPSLASLGGHDLPRFATFWAEFSGGSDAENALRECLLSLASGPARYLMLDLGDLIGETEQDNRPGTGPEAGNWRHRFQLPLSRVANNDQVRELVSMVDEARRDSTVKGARA